MYTINCAAISRELIESELFGHVKGSFYRVCQGSRWPLRAGARKHAIPGRDRRVRPRAPAKLLRALQPPDNGGPCQRVFRPVGATEDRTADVRIVAATNRNLHKLIEEVKFREDLYHRVATITLKLHHFANAATTYASR